MTIQIWYYGLYFVSYLKDSSTSQGFRGCSSIRSGLSSIRYEMRICTLSNQI